MFDIYILFATPVVRIFDIYILFATPVVCIVFEYLDFVCNTCGMYNVSNVHFVYHSYGMCFKFTSFLQHLWYV